METDRTTEFSVNIDSERHGIGRVVITIAVALRLRRRDQVAVPIGPVAHQIELISLLGSFNASVIDSIEQRSSAHKGRSARFGSGLHLKLLHFQTTYASGEKINSPLTKLQSDRNIRVKAGIDRDSEPAELIRPSDRLKRDRAVLFVRQTAAM